MTRIGWLTCVLLGITLAGCGSDDGLGSVRDSTYTVPAGDADALDLQVDMEVGNLVIGGGADELLVFAMIWMVMVGMIVVTASRSHIALDFLVTRADPRQRVWLSIIHNAVMTGACAYATVYCVAFVVRVARLGQASMALELPMAIPHSALVVGFAGTTIASALLLVWNLSPWGLGRSSGEPAYRYAKAVHPPGRIPKALNGFGLWNALVAVLMLAAYGWPIAQFFADPPPQAVVHHMDRGID